MKTVLNKLRVELIVTEPMLRLSVKVLYGKVMEEKSIMSELNVRVVYDGTVLVWYLVQRIDVFNLNVLR